ncbi:helix-turn-helix domain-containing protein [Puniceibacterium confluentis]|uniref:helix-turn-helix domain-containing protein n=1 Tax=Puniceibacterium confluentis TaxID=1958944 RepID=UPI0011B81E39|nr:helix-turn-helix domain-containing protein [Puniceibacterium confluentis]
MTARLTKQQIAKRRRGVAAGFNAGRSDAEIAASLGLSQERVGNIRRALGLKRSNEAQVEARREKVARLHSEGLPDPEIARRTGLSISTVRHCRGVQGLAAHAAAVWHEKQRLAVVAACVADGLSDDEIAARVGRHVSGVRRQRATLGLAANRPKPPLQPQRPPEALNQAEAFVLRALQRLFVDPRPRVSEDLAGRIMAARVAQEPRA